MLCATPLQGDGQPAGDVRPLEVGQQLDRELISRDDHVYSVTLVADHHLQLVIEQQRINVTMTLLGTSGERLADVDGEKSSHGTERLTFIAETAGNYRILLRAVENTAATGAYRITLRALDTPTTEDRVREDARRLSQRSQTLRAQGQYAQALPLERQALALRERVLGPNDLLVGESLHNLAMLYDNTGEYAKAEPLNLRALAIRETLLGPDHPDVAKTLNNLAWIHNVRHDYAKSEALYRRALIIQETALA